MCMCVFLCLYVFSNSFQGLAGQRATAGYEKQCNTLFLKYVEKFTIFANSRPSLAFCSLQIYIREWYSSQSIYLKTREKFNTATTTQYDITVRRRWSRLPRGKTFISTNKYKNVCFYHPRISDIDYNHTTHFNGISALFISNNHNHRYHIIPSKIFNFMKNI